MSGAGIPLNIGDGGLQQPSDALARILAAARASGALPAASPQPMGMSAPPPQQQAMPAPSQPMAQPNGQRPPPNVGDVVNFHKFTGGSPADPNAWAPVSHDDFLHELAKQDPTLAIRVKAIADGREPFPSTSRINPYNRTLQAAVAQYDPEGYDSINNGTRAKLRADFTSGTSALNIRNLNQAIGHLQAMMDEVPNVAGHGGEGLINGDFGLASTLNSAQNAFAKGEGSQGITNYDTAKRALAGELAALFKGKGASSETEVHGWLDQLSADQSDDQKFGTARKLSELLKSRLDELHQQYQQGMGVSSTPFQALNPLAADSYNRLSQIGKAVGSQPSTAAPQTTSGPKIGDVEGGYRFKGGNPADPNSWEKAQ